MSFEIFKVEGCGRLGQFKDIQFETPNLILSRYYSENESQRKLDHTLAGIKKLSGVRTPLNMDISDDYRIECINYPSLQSQNKNINELKILKDLFPLNSLETSVPTFHVIPWDASNLYLNERESFIDKLNQLKQIDIGNSNFFVLNVPFQQKELTIPPPSYVSVLMLGDISSLLNHPKFLIQYIQSVQRITPPNVTFFAPMVPSSYMPFLSYLGIDFFDFTYLDLFYSDIKPKNDLILDLNPTTKNYIDVLTLIKRAIGSGNLRDLVRIYANSNPSLKTMLKLADSTNIFEENTPIYFKKGMFCTDETDLTRVEVERFRERIASRYFPPSLLRGVIFLPCSAKKPYSTSKSHRLFHNVIKRTLRSKRHSILELILTSPLGVVPRELEYTFPAGHYDIPVTGQWSDLEKKHLTQDISSILSKIDPSIPLVGYIKGSERKVLKKVCDMFNREITLLEDDISSLTSNEGLQQFSLLLKEAFSQTDTFLPNKHTHLTFLRTIADFQFGKGVGQILLPNDVRIHGKKELGLRVTLNKFHLLTFRQDSGLLSLSLLAGERLLGYSNNAVTFDGDQIIGSTIFCNAIIKADRDIRPNDEVLVTNRDGKIMAVGISQLSGRLLESMTKGKGIILRKKVK